MMVLTSLSSSLLSSLSSLTGLRPSNSNVCFSSSLPSPRRRLNRKPNHHHRNRHLSLPLLSRTSPTRSIHCSSSFSSMPLEVSTSPSQDSLLCSRAFWVTQSIIAWNADVVRDGSCYLYASQTAALSVTDSEVEGHDFKIKLEEDSGGIPQNVIAKFPHIRDYKAFRVPSTVDAKSLVKCQLAVATFGSDGKCSYATGLQLPGVLDELFAYDGPLGAHYSEDAVSLYLWAPTAQAVCACVYKNANSSDPVEVVQLKEVNGVWSVEGSKDWEGCYYVYEVNVYHPSTLRVEKCYANDPYARGLSPDSQRTLFVNLDSDTLKPEGWEKLADEKPIILSFSDISIYELHVRDFSANDHTVHPDFQGGYLAFTLEDSAGVLHLKKLSNAGITHVHLLPTFQFAGVDDVKENWKCVDSTVLEKLPPDSTEQQAQITLIQDDDGYNWGYNPVLWGVPKGSYASNPISSCRTIEFRKMVQALNRIGLRVVLDVVYNHLHGNGPFDENSVLDKIVPGYYLRRNTDGFIEHSTCVNNTASEHYMVERLIIDDMLNWAGNYKVDGFRFDLMGHIMKSTMVKAKDAVNRLTKERDGIDGSSVYIYGEGWDFGEVANNGRGINASQFNIGGTGIGSFNDRIRDAMLGGSPFGHPLQQGFVTGLMLQPNGHDHGGKDVEELMLSAAKDHIQVGMAANLRDYVLTNSDGKEVKGMEVLTYGGAPVAYALHPAETINYVSAHDNETLFDVVSMKTPMEISVDERCRLNHLASSVIALSQGIPFFHSGDEMLRSKSLDRDSYNSGDWFNRLDFTYNSNNWGVGLPPKQKNEKHWPLIRPRLADPSFKPQKNHILAAINNFLDVLQIRYSSPLFRLTTANAIQERVRFHNTGPSWVPGVIVMSFEDGHRGVPGLTQLDPIYSFIVVIFNASPSEVSFASPVLRARTFQLHPIQAMSADEVVKNSSYETSTGCFTVPPRTTSVFVEYR
ncbi:PREDICTED: pullulanase 1, chloroplastic isoform X2 [Populus euphratica]|uniref:Pullulanase 1, chloroplastic isoform X2 n=1 Tax=Populus euphratica TaxID=75702 RepID=A0AAJ6XMP5_POPEU|nr:PREDICTED: pullulanase 1, chloroplastic isoform X2 [Populus euphratica]